MIFEQLTTVKGVEAEAVLTSVPKAGIPQSTGVSTLAALAMQATSRCSRLGDMLYNRYLEVVHLEARSIKETCNRFQRWHGSRPWSDLPFSQNVFDGQMSPSLKGQFYAQPRAFLFRFMRVSKPKQRSFFSPINRHLKHSQPILSPFSLPHLFFNPHTFPIHQYQLTHTLSPLDIIPIPDQ